MSRYTKALVGVVTWIVVFIQSLYTAPVFQDAVADSNITEDEAIKLIFVALGVLGVYGFKNTPPVGQAANPNISEAERS